MYVFVLAFDSAQRYVSRVFVHVFDSALWYVSRVFVRVFDSALRYVSRVFVRVFDSALWYVLPISLQWLCESNCRTRQKVVWSAILLRVWAQRV